MNWSDDRFYVKSPKTEQYVAKEGRIVPIFPRLRSHLEECLENAAEGAEHVISAHNIASSNLRTTMKKLLIRARLNS